MHCRVLAVNWSGEGENSHCPFGTVAQVHRTYRPMSDFVRRVPYPLSLAGATSMRTFGQQAAYVVKHPGTFALRVLRAFRANQGLLLAGACAYYMLLSIVPLLILILIVSSQILDQVQLLTT